MSVVELPRSSGPVWTVLPRRLLLSGTWKHWPQDKCWRLLRQHGIQNVFNLGQREQSFLELAVENYSYHHVQDSRRSVSPEVESIALCATERVEAGRGVLVMCHGGRNRSALVAALVLRNLWGCSGAEAMSAIRSVKSSVLTNELFCEFLAALPPPRS